MTLQVFLSWSGPKSKELAAFLTEWLPKVIQAVKPWMSDDIEKGDRWQAVDSSLEQVSVGIICLTKSNLTVCRT